ncbi:FecR domain-containing protein [Porticoccaceae bacterium LTM1]|nr:FecR domain-containing protein [Porticoccaceae bacterium LTM1]
MSEFIKRQAKRKAAADYVRLYGAEDSEGIQPQHWEKLSGEYQKQFQSMKEVMADIEALASDPEILNEVDSVSSVRESKKFGHGIWPSLSVAAMLLVAVSVAFVGWQSGYFDGSPEVVEGQRFITRVGEQKTIQLEDGSELILNTNTQAIVEMRPDKRIVFLDKGELYLDVEKDEERPFVVLTSDRAVTVLGTQFSVMNEGGLYRVSVNEGKVALHQRNNSFNGYEEIDLNASNLKLDSVKPYALSAGMQASIDFDSNSLVASGFDSKEALFSWTKGMLRVEDLPLSDVVEELNRFSGRHVVIVDEEISGLTVSMSIRVSSISDAFVAVEEILPVKVDRTFNEILLSKRDM